jgi:hypothetical protein
MPNSDLELERPHPAMKRKQWYPKPKEAAKWIRLESGITFQSFRRR